MTEILLTTSADVIILTMLGITVRFIIIEPRFIYKVEFLVENKNFTGAETLVKAHIKKHGQDLTVNYWQGEIYLQTSRQKDSVKIFEALISKKISRYKNYHHELFHLATFYKDGNFSEKVLTYIEQLINLDSHNPAYYILISVASTNVTSPEQIMSLHYELAELYVVIQEFDKAITQWEHIIHIDKNYLDVKQKLQDSSLIYLSNFFKDLLTKSNNESIKTACEFVKKFKYVIDNYKTIRSDIITVAASEVTI